MSNLTLITKDNIQVTIQKNQPNGFASKFIFTKPDGTTLELNLSDDEFEAMKFMFDY